jgi:hypothetical protein
MNRRFFLPVCLFLVAALLPAGGGREKGDIVQVTGRVRLVGNEPFTELVIWGQDRQWYIAKEDEHKLKDLQHRTVTVEAEETATEITFANGRSAGIRRTLRKIKIILVE